MFDTLTVIKDRLHAQLCYYLMITPLPIRVEEEYQDFAQKACAFFNSKRTKLIVREAPRHHVIHHFAQLHQSNAKKILITHGWMSRAAYMVKLIRALTQEGYDVYALDFPAHGEAKGWQLPWYDAVTLLKDVLDNLGPFYGVIGHSFGGAMLFNTLNLAGQLLDWQLKYSPQKAVLIASPTSMRTPVIRMARQIGLTGPGLVYLRNVFQQKSFIDITRLNFRSFAQHAEIPVLCIHGQEDKTIHPKESITFCRRYAQASLALLPNVDHIGVLIDERIEQKTIDFLA